MQHILTVGHSTLSIEEFVAVLQRHSVDVVADVRSHPYSARFPHFSKVRLRASLKSEGIRYVFLGRELGARRDEAECYVNGQATYERIATLPVFSQGIDRLLMGAQKYRVAIMCAEQDPLTCHRTILVCYELKKRGVLIKHICRTGALEDHEETERRLVEEELRGAQQDDLFTKSHSLSEILEQAYAKRAGNIAYRLEERSDDYSHDRIHAEIR